MLINLLSDTVTKPTKNMRQAMANAEVGDDVFQQDPTVNALQERLADMFGHEAALFCPSGTMTNQIAINVHTNPLEEVICDYTSHIYQYETSGYAYNARVGINLLSGEYGKINPEMVEKAVKGKYDWLPESKLVVLENSTNKGGGNYYTLEEQKAIKQVCDGRGMKMHLDGARLFNVLVETKESTHDIGACYDSISICLSKGLGAPVGSVLISDKETITRARRFRKVMGGGMRQAGIIAAGCLYALDSHVDRLATDNKNARKIGQHLSTLPYVKEVLPVKTNIIIFTLKERMAQPLVDELKEHGILASAFGPQQIRFVTHMEITSEMISDLQRIMESIK